LRLAWCFGRITKGVLEWIGFLGEMALAVLAAEVVVVAVLGWFGRRCEWRIGCSWCAVFDAVGCRIVVWLFDGGYAGFCCALAAKNGDKDNVVLFN
jgi:hypothetical protein